MTSTCMCNNLCVLRGLQLSNIMCKILKSQEIFQDFKDFGICFCKILPNKIQTECDFKILRKISFGILVQFSIKVYEISPCCGPPVGVFTLISPTPDLHAIL